MPSDGRKYSRVVLMGDPSFFQIKKGANPHTRNWLGMKKKVDTEKAFLQWHTMAQTLMRYGVQIYVVPADENCSGLVFPANSGLTREVEIPLAMSQRRFILSNPSPARAAEKGIYADFLSNLGLMVQTITSQFEGEADLIPWGDLFLFTYGSIKRQHFVPRIGIPPWKPVYGFPTELRTLDELTHWFPREKIIPVELTNEFFYHGDTVFCTFGPERRYLLACREAITGDAVERLKEDSSIIWLDRHDSEAFAANSFQIHYEGRLFLFMPVGVSRKLIDMIQERGVEVVLIDVSEFFHKGGGSVKCLVGDLGVWAEDRDLSKETAEFRKHHQYSHYFANQPCAH